MPKFQVMPDPAPEQYAALRDDIRLNGIRHPIEVDENGDVLDGHIRLKISRQLKVDAPQVEVKDLGSDDAKRAYAFRMNVLRRHLSKERRDEAAAQLAPILRRMLENEPQAQVAKQVGIDQQRVSEIVSNTESGKANKTDHRLKLNPKEYPKILQRIDGGETQEQIAADYDISRGRIAQIVGQQRKIAERKAKRLANEAQATMAGVAAIEVADALDWLADVEPCDLLLTDPPYSTDVVDIGIFAQDWLPLALSTVKPTGSALFFIGAYPEELLAYLSVRLPTQILGWEFKNVTRLVPTDRFKSNYQSVLFYRGTDAPPLNVTDGNTTSWAMQSMNAPDARHGERDYKWQKPIELLTRYVELLTQAGDRILDPFAGSGSTLLAAASVGRFAYGCEKDPAVAAIAKERGVQLGQSKEEAAA